MQNSNLRMCWELNMMINTFTDVLTLLQNCVMWNNGVYLSDYLWHSYRVYYNKYPLQLQVVQVGLTNCTNTSPKVRDRSNYYRILSRDDKALVQRMSSIALDYVQRSKYSSSNYEVQGERDKMSKGDKPMHMENLKSMFVYI